MADRPLKLAAKKGDLGVASKHPRLGAFKNDELTKAITAKLVEAPVGSRLVNRMGATQTAAPDGQMAWNVTDKTANSIADNRNMMQLLPDLELAKQILINSILSPNDMLSCELTFSSNAKLLGDLEIPLLQVVETYFKQNYRIEDLLPTILEDVLFKTGSYALAVLPESVVDDAINSPERVSIATMESLRGEFDASGQPKPLGILGSNEKPVRGNRSGYVVGMESLRSSDDIPTGSRNIATEGLYLTVTDNPNVLKQPLLLDKITATRIQDRLTLRRLSVENNTSGQGAAAEAAMRASLFKARSYTNTPVLALQTQAMLDKESVGHPLVMTLPAESVLPVHTPSNPDEHVGYFVLLDQTGNPLAKAQLSDYYNDLVTNINRNKSMVSQMLNVARRGTEGRDTDVNRYMDLEAATSLYMNVVEQDLMQRLKNGVYGDNVRVARPPEVYRIMLARACAKMYTQLLYVPTQMMTYIAFDHNQHGVGVSLLENTKIIGSMRAMMLFANTMAGIKNSVGHVELNIELDPNDPDPGHTIEMMAHEYVKTRQAAYPIGQSNPLDLVNHLQAAGVEITAQGHPGWPTTKLSVNDKTTNRAKVDTELDDSLRKRHLMGIGVAPETVEMSMGADFAASVLQQNLLLAKRAMLTGRRLTRGVSDHIQKFTNASETLCRQMRDILNEKKDLVTKLDPGNKYGVDGLVTYFISTIEVSLPEPNMKGIELQLTGFEEYSKALDTVIPAFVSSEMFDSNIIGELGNSINTAIAIIKAYYQRKWLRENNVLPELFEMLTHAEGKDSIAFDLLATHKDHMESLNKSLMGFLKTALKKKAKTDEELNALGGVEEGAAGGSDAGGEGGDEAGGGEDDMGFDFGEPPGGDEAAVEEGAAEGEEPPPEEGGEETAEEPAAKDEKPETGTEEKPQ